MKRRDFLAAAAILATDTLRTREAGAAIAGAVGKEALIADRLIDTYPLRQSLVAIGEACWQDDAFAGTGCYAPPFPSLVEAVRDFLDHIDLPAAEAMEASPTELRARIEAGTISDFSEERTVQVRGWLLGETESRLCAIAALRAHSKSYRAISWRCP